MPSFSLKKAKDIESIDKACEEIFDEAFRRYSSLPHGDKPGSPALRMEFSKFRKNGRHPRVHQTMVAALALGATVTIDIKFPEEKGS